MKPLIALGIAAAISTITPAPWVADALAGTTAQVKPTAPDTAEFDKQMAKAQENMKKMQTQMDQIHQTQDPQARQKLLQEHWATMQSNMQIMHELWGSGTTGCCMGGHMMGQGMMGGHMMDGPMWGDYRHLTPEQLKQRQYMADRIMPMQQMMMDHMMQHQQWMWQQPK